jgi:hypothetical protein
VGAALRPEEGPCFLESGHRQPHEVAGTPLSLRAGRARRR